MSCPNSLWGHINFQIQNQSVLFLKSTPTDKYISLLLIWSCCGCGNFYLYWAREQDCWKRVSAAQTLCAFVKCSRTQTAQTTQLTEERSILRPRRKDSGKTRPERNESTRCYWTSRKTRNPWFFLLEGCERRGAWANERKKGEPKRQLERRGTGQREERLPRQPKPLTVLLSAFPEHTIFFGPTSPWSSPWLVSKQVHLVLPDAY